MKYLWVYDYNIQNTKGAASVNNIAVSPAKQQVLEIVIIAIKTPVLAAARNIDCYVHLNPDDSGGFHYLFDKDMNSENYFYPRPDDLYSHDSINVDRLILNDEDEFVITATNLANNESFRIQLRCWLSIYALPTVTYDKYLSGTSTTLTKYQNKIIGVK